ncbi:Bidirectional sugar transporter SWEET10-like [Vigna unguiculata]|uniref:Bidirectional sugar transporter SWEET n=2 Tax=Vigna unguiculata TaxID=3917 RepID=A0A4D6L5G1_VIGUN|nr:Bidirectional sugar transporter SWEET10-like [Vigna unguiculata]
MKRRSGLHLHHERCFEMCIRDSPLTTRAIEREKEITSTEASHFHSHHSVSDREEILDSTHHTKMAIHHETWAFVFGLLGNAISFMVFLAPLPTFYQIYKKKTAEGFQSLPYVVALFSSMLWIYYAMVKKDASLLLITINSFGCVIESMYLLIFLIYAPSKTRLSTIKLLLLLNVFGFGAMLLSTLYFTTGTKRLSVIGWICLVFNISVFAAPLCIMKRVIKTKSVEFMPFSLSFFLTVNAVMWFFYGLLLKDYYIALPNTLGFVFGIIQMVLYLVYRNAKPKTLEEPTKLQELNGHIVDVVKLGTMTP